MDQQARNIDSLTMVIDAEIERVVRDAKTAYKKL